METVPVATTDTIDIKGRKTHQLIVNHKGMGKGMSDPMGKSINILVVVKNRPENQRKKVKKSSCP